jgi:hypothetical protein
MNNDVFKNLGEEKAMELYNWFIAQGMNEDDAFTEVYSIECNMDDDE